MCVRKPSNSSINNAESGRKTINRLHKHEVFSTIPAAFLITLNLIYFEGNSFQTAELIFLN